MEHVLPGYLAEYLQRKLAGAGVTAVADTALAGLRCSVVVAVFPCLAYGAVNVDVKEGRNTFLLRPRSYSYSYSYSFTPLVLFCFVFRCCCW